MPSHFHIIARHGDLDLELRSPRVFNLLGADPAEAAPDAVMDEIALRISVAPTRAAGDSRLPGT